MGYYTSFIIRIWIDDTEGFVRGQIQHVNSQETSYFNNQKKMNEFILSHLSPPKCDSTLENDPDLSETDISTRDRDHQ
jgi:hypothetical protein